MIPLQQSLREIESGTLPVTCRVTNYAPNAVIEPHTHGKHQLVYAIQGVMVVQTSGGVWIVPPTRAIWMPAGTQHSIRCIGAIHMRSLFVMPDAASGLPQVAQAVGISPLLRELIVAAAEVELPYTPKSRDGRLMRLLLDELHALPVLPLHLPQPADARLRKICTRIQREPDDVSTLADWADQLGVDVKTIQRLFARDTGMTFGQWRQQARLLNALERLAQGERVLDVALALGYDSPSAFAAMFRRQFGQTPSSFFR
ncbi:MAG TPA: helix-turn-helix transcriptional regulator [Rhodocyclaceae bacterium]|jgi:AraC-like DNA-binding protein/quercetin dioxygenase-like cupin family protein|nr:helix-turn-helix transcriptional regulator [Rhodocyclaceae bacterium]